MTTFALKTVFVSAAMIAATASPASAKEVFQNPTFAPGVSTVSNSAQAMVDDCLGTDSTSRAVRACTKLLRASAPNPDVRARLHAQRALHQMALGRFDAAAEDFTRAGDLSGDDSLTNMGHGFVAMLDEDLTTAKAKFDDCSQSAAVAPLAEYGLGLAHQMSGNADAASEAYDRALDMRPGWTAVAEQKATLD